MNFLPLKKVMFYARLWQARLLRLCPNGPYPHYARKLSMYAHAMLCIPTPCTVRFVCESILTCNRARKPVFHGLTVTCPYKYTGVGITFKYIDEL